MHRHVPPPVRPLVPRLRPAGLLAAGLAGLVVLSAGLPAFAQQPPSPAAEPPDAAVAMQQPPAAEPAPAEPRGWRDRAGLGRRHAAGSVPRGVHRRHRGHLDEPRRLAGRPRDRLRPARRPLHRADRGRRGDRADLRLRLGHAAALQPRRPLDRLHQRPRRRRQRVDRRPRRWRSGDPGAGHRRGLPPGQQPRLDAGRAVPGGAQALRVAALARLRRDLALPPLRHRRPADDREAERAEGRRRADLLPRRALPLLLAGHHPRAGVRVQQGPQRRHLLGAPPRPRERARSSTGSADPGGAVRPTPSPDGRRVAFVRRVRAESTLWLKDVASGAEWQVAGGLDRDMQETWAIHGVYPSLAWTPDSASIVYWAGGGIHRLDVATGTVSEIPFHVAATKKLTDALRFPVDVAPATFKARMLRWVEVSMDGSKVVFGALGRVWIQDLPDGTPRRLTRQDDHLEYFPSFSRDGSQVVFVSWDDDALGAVRVAASGTGSLGVRPRGDERAGPLRRADLLARRRDDRLPQDRRRLSAQPDVERRAGALRGAVRRRRGPQADRFRARPPLRRRPRPRLLPRRRRGGRGRAEEAAQARSASTAATSRPTPCRSTPPSSASRRTASGWPGASCSTPTSHRWWPPAGRWRSGRTARRCRSPRCRATPAATCTGRATATAGRSPCTGRSARSSSAATSATPSPSSPAPRQRCPSRRPRDSTSISRWRATCRPAPWRWRAAGW